MAWRKRYILLVALVMVAVLGSWAWSRRTTEQQHPAFVGRWLVNEQIEGIHGVPVAVSTLYTFGPGGDLSRATTYRDSNLPIEQPQVFKPQQPKSLLPKLPRFITRLIPTPRRRSADLRSTGRVSLPVDPQCEGACLLQATCSLGTHWSSRDATTLVVKGDCSDGRRREIVLQVELAPNQLGKATLVSVGGEAGWRGFDTLWDLRRCPSLKGRCAPRWASVLRER